MAKETILATDTNIFMQRSHHVYGDLKRPDGYPSGIVYGTIVSISNLIKTFKPDYFLPVFDYGKSNHRKSISGDYKGNRVKKDEPMVNQFTAVRMVFDFVGLNPYYERNVEADDLLAKLAIDHSKGKELIICTQDHDMFQLISDNVSIYRPKMGRRESQMLTHKNAKFELGIEPSRLAEVWAISGDGGDNVKGVPGYGPKKSLKAILEHGSLVRAIANDPKLTPYSDQCLESYELIRLDGKVATKEPNLVRLEELQEVIYDNEDMMEFFELWGMTSLLEQYAARTLFTP